MVNAGIYLALMIVFFIICINKKYGILALCLVGYYLMIAIISLYAEKRGVIDGSKTSIIPYIILLVAYTLYFFPFLKKRSTVSLDKFDCNTISKLKTFGIVYIVCAFICIYCYINPLKELIQSGQWAMTRYMHYQEGNTTVYTNIVEQVGIAFSLYFYLLAVIVSIVMLKQGKTSRFAYMLLGSAVVSNFMQALYAVGRGTIFNDLMIVIILYLFVIKDLNKKNILFCAGLIVIAILVIIPYISAITESRFSTDAENELLRYFGEAPVVFNANVATIDRPALGKYMFSRIFNTGFSQEEIGGTWGARFFTFVGYIYIDWGVIGVLLGGIFWGLFYFNRKVQLTSWKLSDFFIIMFYYRSLLKGALVIGSGFLQDVIFAAITYVFLKYVLEKIKFPKVVCGDKQII